MKQSIYYGLLFYLSHLSYTVGMKIVHAHEAESSNNISALLHIDPNDAPVIHKEAKFFFTFEQNDSGNFDITKCNCTITLLKGEEQLDMQPVLAVDDSSFTSVGSRPLYIRTFTDPGDYKIVLAGSPKDDASFESFTLDYKIQVFESGNAVSGVHSMAHQHLGHIIIFGGGLIAALILLVRNYYQKRKEDQVQSKM